MTHPIASDPIVLSLLVVSGVVFSVVFFFLVFQFLKSQRLFMREVHELHGRFTRLYDEIHGRLIPAIVSLQDTPQPPKEDMIFTPDKEYPAILKVTPEGKLIYRDPHTGRIVHLRDYTPEKVEEHISYRPDYYFLKEQLVDGTVIYHPKRKHPQP